MADILISDGVIESTSAPTAFYDQLIGNNYIQSTSQACIVDLTPPTFAGIATLINGSKGQLRSTWLAGTDATAPVRYEIYVKALTATGLFSAINLVALTDKLQFDVFSLGDGSFVQSGIQYFVGVRAIDGVGNRDGNVVTLNVVSTGITGAVTIYESHGAFAISPTNMFQGTMWATKNGILDPTMVLGTASYQVYNKAGAAIVGLSEINIAADVNGQFIITPVSASALNQSLDHYMVKVSIIMDSVQRSDYIPIIQKSPDYDISGLFFTNVSGQFDGTFWVSADEKLKTTGLGTGAYQVFDSDGTLVAGMSQSGIAADANGIYKITAIPSTLSDEFAGYSVRVTLTVDSTVRSEMFAITGPVINYEVKGVFSINALNQFQATFWVAQDGHIELTLGVANYTVYDSAGIAVSGLTQSGITADGNGRFQITPVSALLLTDLTHYTVKIGILVHGIERIVYKGFSLLGN